MRSNINMKKEKRLKNINLTNYLVYIIFILVIAIFAIWLGGTFFSVTNLLNIVRQTAMISIMAIAMTFVIASGQIDLSIGSTVAFIGIITAMVLLATNSIILAVVAGLALGAVIGLINGVFVAYVGIPSFLVTLGMQGIIKGFAMWVSNTAAIPILNETYNYIFGLGDIGGIPILLFWTVFILGLGILALYYMPYGKKVLAIGGNAQAAKFTGIRVKRLTTIALIVSSVAASFAAILYTGRMETARYSFGEGDELSVIAAVILGGTSLAGGTGNVIGTVIGSLLMGTINNGLIIGGLSVSQQMIVRGAMIILAVSLGTIGGKGKTRNS